jgi:hypothetical protein
MTAAASAAVAVRLVVVSRVAVRMIMRPSGTSFFHFRELPPHVFRHIVQALYLARRGPGQIHERLQRLGQLADRRAGLGRPRDRGIQNNRRRVRN